MKRKDYRVIGRIHGTDLAKWFGIQDHTQMSSMPSRMWNVQKFQRQRDITYNRLREDAMGKKTGIGEFFWAIPIDQTETEIVLDFEHGEPRTVYHGDKDWDDYPAAYHPYHKTEGALDTAPRRDDRSYFEKLTKQLRKAGFDLTAEYVKSVVVYEEEVDKLQS